MNPSVWNGFLIMKQKRGIDFSILGELITVIVVAETMIKGSG